MQLSIGNLTLKLSRERSASGGTSGRSSAVSSQNSGPSLPEERMAAALSSPSGYSPWLIGNAEGRNSTRNLDYIRDTVAACMHARSEAIGRGRFHVYELGRTSSELRGTDPPRMKTLVQPHDPLERLLAAPNPVFDLSDMLELSSQWLDATGNALWLKVRNGAGAVVELWPVAALSFAIERGADETPAIYRFLPSNTRVPAADIIHIRRSDIRTSPLLGQGLLADILDTAKADTAIRLFQSRFFENDATPRTILRWPQGSFMTQQTMDDLRARWEQAYGSRNGTFANAGRIAILADGGEVQTVGTGARELDFARSKQELRDAIREAFRVPRIVLGDVENVNLANAETSYQVFLRDVVDHALAKHARALTRALVPEFHPGRSDITVEHDSVIPDAEDRFLARLRELKSAMTLNEQRALLGLPAVPGGEALPNAGALA